MANIKFGTDGWRAVVGKDFNDENVKLVIKAIAQYVLDEFGINKKIIIGYDPRNKADEYAKLSAEILTEIGFNVILSEKFIPTPILAFYAKTLDASAIMFTASHNPPEYLGIKYIPDYAGPATSEITEQIVKNIGCNPQKTQSGTISTKFFYAEYAEHLQEIVDFKSIRKLEKNIIFDALYSAASGYFDKLLDENNIKYEKEYSFSNLWLGEGSLKRKARFDFYVNKEYCIEFDGIQHFKSGTGYFDNLDKFQKTQNYDQIKNEYCFNNNIPLIRIPYTHLKELCLEDLLLETSKFIISKKERD